MPELELRPATAADKSFLRELANDPAAIAASSYTTRISEEEHAAWFSRKLADPDCRISIAIFQNKPAGALRLEREEDAWRVSISVLKDFRGLNIASAMLAQGCCDPVLYKATVRNHNEPSLKLFAGAGFAAIARDEEKTVFALDNRPV